MILAAPLVIPFAEAIGLSVATLGIAKASDMVNEYIQENPEQSMKIFQMIMPSQGIANALKNKSSEGDEEVQESEIFMNKEKISLEDLDEMTDEEAADLPNEDKAELMKQAGKKRDRELSIATSEKLSLSGPGKEKIDIEREIDERVDPGGIQKEKKGYDFRDYIPKGAYKKRYADGGAIGIEVLFEPKREKFNTGGTPYDARATTQDYANALQKVSAGTTYQQQAQAKDYARNEAANELRAARQGGDVALDNFLQGAGLSRYRSTFTDSRPGTNRQGAFTGTYKMNMDSILNDLMNKKLQPTSYAAPDPFKKQMDALDAIKAENRRLVNEYTANNPSTINPMNPSLLGSGIAQLNTPGSTPSPPTPAYMDQTLLNQLTKLTPEQATLFDPFDQLSDLDQYNLSQAYPELQSQLRDSSYVSPYGLQGDQELFSRRYGIKDGGRVGLFMGGDPLTGQALSIYDSMKAYNFSDQEIANALSARGLSELGTSNIPDTTIQPIGLQSSNGGGGGGGITELDPLNRPKGTPFDLNSLTKTKFGYNNALGRTIEGVKDFTGSMIDKFSGSKIGEGITSGATKFKNMAFTPMMALMQKRNPLNPSATNYNPNLQKQMDFLELQENMIGIDPNSGLAKYGPESVLSGQNVVSGFGTNDYEGQLGKYITKMRNYKNLTNFQKKQLEKAKAEVAKEVARREQETADRARAANPGVYASADRQGFTDGKGGGFGSKSTGTNDAFSNESGRGRTGYSDGGLVTMFKEKR